MRCSDGVNGKDHLLWRGIVDLPWVQVIYYAGVSLYCALYYRNSVLTEPAGGGLLLYRGIVLFDCVVRVTTG